MTSMTWPLGCMSLRVSSLLLSVILVRARGRATALPGESSKLPSAVHVFSVASRMDQPRRLIVLSPKFSISIYSSSSSFPTVLGYTSEKRKVWSDMTGMAGADASVFSAVLLTSVVSVVAFFMSAAISEVGGETVWTTLLVAGASGAETEMGAVEEADLMKCCLGRF